MNNSDVLAYNKKYIANPIDVTFNVLEAFEGTEKQYAKLELAVKNNDCLMGEDCTFEMEQIDKLKAAPKLFVDFMANVSGELKTTETDNYDPNSNADYAVANSILTKKPGFSKSDGYNVVLTLLPDGTQRIVFSGPMFYEDLVINSSTINVILENNTYLVSPTPNVPLEMDALMVEIGLFDPSMFDQESKKLNNGATISEEFILTNTDGSPDYEIIEIGNGKGRNVLKYDFDKMEKKVMPFVKAEVAGLLDSQQEGIAAWNVYIAQDSEGDDEKISEDLYAWRNSWSYEADLPLSDDKKYMFLDGYKRYFAKNYIMNYTVNQLPLIEEDAGVFDLAEMKEAKAQKFIDDNNLN